MGQADQGDDAKDHAEENGVAVGDRGPACRPDRVALTSQGGDPLGRSPQCLRQAGARGRHPRIFDPVEEGRAEAAQQEQRPDPPGAGQSHRKRPPTQETPSNSAAACQDPPRRKDEDRQGRHGVDRTETEGGDSRVQRSSALPTGRDGHERQDEPRGDRHRPQFGTDGSEPHEHSRCQGVGEGRHQAGGSPTDAQPDQQPVHAVPCHEKQECPPQALHDPCRQTQLVTHPEERAHREEVPVGLVLELSGGTVGVPKAE